MLSAMSWINSITWAVDFQLRLFLSILLTLGGGHNLFYLCGLQLSLLMKLNQTYKRNNSLPNINAIILYCILLWLTCIIHHVDNGSEIILV